MQFPIRLLAVFMTAAAAVQAMAISLDDPPSCAVVPQDFWECIDYCLQQKCSGTNGDPNCVNPCDADCSKFTCF